MNFAKKTGLALLGAAAICLAAVLGLQQSYPIPADLTGLEEAVSAFDLNTLKLFNAAGEDVTAHYDLSGGGL